MFSGIKIAKATALQNHWVLSPPSLMAVRGFVYAMGLQCGFLNAEFAVIHHNVQYLGSWNGYKYTSQDGKNVRAYHADFLPEQFKAASFIDADDCIAGTIQLAMQPSVRCNAEMSLIIKISDAEADDIDHRALRNFMFCGKIAAGDITDFKQRIIKKDGQERTLLDYTEVKKCINSGFFVLDRSDIIEDTLKNNSDMDGFDVVLDMFFDFEMRKNYGWLGLTTVGYQAFEPFVNRLSVRSGLTHAYGEGIIGLIEYRSVHNEFADIPFWKYTADSSTGVFLLSSINKGDL